MLYKKSLTEIESAAWFADLSLVQCTILNEGVAADRFLSMKSPFNLLMSDLIFFFFLLFIFLTGVYSIIN